MDNKNKNNDENELITERRRKLSLLREQGNAFPNHFRRSSFADELHVEYDSSDKESLEKIINRLIDTHKTNFKGVGQPLRIALTGSRFGPGIYDIILSLDKNETTKRLKLV